MQNTRQYELIYVVSPSATEQEVTDLHAQIEAIVARFGAVLAKSENWGRRKLAYEIGGHKEATYVLEVIDGTGDVMKEIDRRLKVSEQVLRHLVVRVDEEIQAAERLKARRQVEAARHAARHPGAVKPAEPGEAGPQAAGEIGGAGDEGAEA
jgi:small subunit ribosomal protein S6